MVMITYYFRDEKIQAPPDIEPHDIQKMWSATYPEIGNCEIVRRTASHYEFVSSFKPIRDDAPSPYKEKYQGQKKASWQKQLQAYLDMIPGTYNITNIDGSSLLSVNFKIQDENDILDIVNGLLKHLGDFTKK